jgi:uncharacterized protein (DUF433 family)
VSQVYNHRLTEEQLIDHYPQLAVADIRASAAYAADLARERIWKLATSA